MGHDEKVFSRRQTIMATKPKHPAAVALGKLNKGVPKRITDKERAARAERMAFARSKRHPIKRQQSNAGGEH
jgi:hypothetical protein